MKNNAGSKTSESVKIITTLLGILTILLVGIVLKQARDIVTPLVIAWLLSFILGPAINFFTARKVPMPFAVAFVLVILIGVLYLTGIFLYSRIAVFADAYPGYQERLNDMVTSVMQPVAERLNINTAKLSSINWQPRAASLAATMAGNVVTIVSKFVLVVIFLIFLLIGKPYLPYKIKKAFSPAKADQITRIIGSMSRDISRYLGLQCLISLATGICVWLALSLLRVDFPVTWGALAFFLNFIPTVGSIIATIPPVLLAWVQFHPSIWPMVLTLVVLFAIQMTIGNVLAPKIMGDNLNLSPVVVLSALVFFGWMWGITGALLAIPIASAIKIVCENIESLHPISILMGSGKIFSDEFRK